MCTCACVLCASVDVHTHVHENITGIIVSVRVPETSAAHSEWKEESFIHSHIHTHNHKLTLLLLLSVLQSLPEPHTYTAQDSDLKSESL